MTECCLLVCFRPLSYTRLLSDIIRGVPAADVNVAINSSKLKKLVSYLSSYPKKLDIATKDIKRLILNGLKSRKTGHAVIYAEILVSLLSSIDGSSELISLISRSIESTMQELYK